MGISKRTFTLILSFLAMTLSGCTSITPTCKTESGNNTYFLVDNNSQNDGYQKLMQHAKSNKSMQNFIQRYGMPNYISIGNRSYQWKNETRIVKLFSIYYKETGTEFAFAQQPNNSLEYSEHRPFNPEATVFKILDAKTNC